MGTSKREKRQGWEALSHNAPHILRELQLHSKVSTSRLIFISLSICSALWDNYAILKNRGLKTVGNSIYSKIRNKDKGLDLLKYVSQIMSVKNALTRPICHLKDICNWGACDIRMRCGSPSYTVCFKFRSVNPCRLQN